MSACGFDDDRFVECVDCLVWSLWEGGLVGACDDDDDRFVECA